MRPSSKLVKTVGAVALALVLLYMVWGRTVRAVFYLAEGWLLHNVAGACAIVRWVPATIAMERLSVDSYKLVFPELDIDEVRFLVCDEYTTLAQVYLRCRDYANAQSALAREEGILCDDIKDQANKLRAGRALVSIRLYEARMFRAQNKLAEASEKYRQCIAAGEAISSTNIELDKSRFALALASAHKELVDCIVAQSHLDSQSR